MRVVQLQPDDGDAPFRDIACLHQAEIHDGALPLLGTRFMTRLYRELTRLPDCGVWIAVDQDRIVGFLVGSADFPGSFRRVLLRSGWILAWHALPRLFSWRLLSKIPTILMYPFRHRPTAGTQAAQEPIKAELLAIAVEAAGRGQGVGRKLVDCFEGFLRQRGVTRYQVTTNAADGDSQAFYRKMRCEPTDVIPHHQLVLQRFSKHLSPITEEAA